ncbi:unnamed protein product [Closterium sp. Yama58-4]|nr:unnamed protein product [Closterium sp. Yama58-4]
MGERLGKGSFGVVHECRNRHTGFQYACKIIDKKQLRDDADAEDVRREVRLLARLAGHPNVVELQDVYEDDGHVYLIMELCSGGDLFDEIKRHGPFAEEDARAIFRQLATSMAYCHAQGIMHRDIKPENVLLLAPTGRPPVTPQPALGREQSGADSKGKAEGTAVSSAQGQEQGKGQSPSQALGPVIRHLNLGFLGSSAPVPMARGGVAKLADFGLAMELPPGESAAGLTGSRYYTAPEMVRGRRYGKRADVWSMGVVLCTLLTGRLPFAGKTHNDDEGLRKSILRGAINFEAAVWRSVSPLARDLVRQMLTVDPRCRLKAKHVVDHPWLLSVACPPRLTSTSLVPKGRGIPLSELCNSAALAAAAAAAAAAGLMIAEAGAGPGSPSGSEGSAGEDDDDGSYSPDYGPIGSIPPSPPGEPLPMPSRPCSPLPGRNSRSRKPGTPRSFRRTLFPPGGGSGAAAGAVGGSTRGGGKVGAGASGGPARGPAAAATAAAAAAASAAMALGPSDASPPATHSANESPAPPPPAVPPGNSTAAPSALPHSPDAANGSDKEEGMVLQPLVDYGNMDDWDEDADVEDDLLRPAVERVSDSPSRPPHSPLPAAETKGGEGEGRKRGDGEEEGARTGGEWGGGEEGEKDGEISEEEGRSGGEGRAERDRGDRGHQVDEFGRVVRKGEGSESDDDARDTGGTGAASSAAPPSAAAAPSSAVPSAPAPSPGDGDMPGAANGGASSEEKGKSEDDVSMEVDGRDDDEKDAQEEGTGREKGKGGEKKRSGKKEGKSGSKHGSRSGAGGGGGEEKGGDGKSKSGLSSKQALLRVGVAEVVKEVLKPVWKERGLSREMFKTIAKKAVEKVVGAVQEKHLPKNEKQVQAYLSEHRKERITSLVQAYVDKYKKG